MEDCAKNGGVYHGIQYFYLRLDSILCVKK